MRQTRLENLRPQRRNVNRHTPRGEATLRDSIQADGWIGAITVAADGETFDGSARIEQGVAAGFNEAILVETDGTRPVVVRRIDIPTAADPRAVRLGLAANRVAQLNLDWNPDVLQELAAADAALLDGLWRDEELAALLAGLVQTPEPGAGGDDFDPTPQEGPTRTQPGDLWTLGPHRLLVGDSTDPAQVARLMGGARATLLVTDPPYNIGLQYGDLVNDAKTPGEYEAFSRLWLALWQQHSERQIVTPGTRNLQVWLRWFDPQYVAPRILPFSRSPGSISYLSSWGPIFFFGQGWGKQRVNDVFEYGARFDKTAVGHPCPKPVLMWADLLEHYTDRGDLVADAFLGSGTTLIAAHRTGRVCYGCEISQRYADVALRRAEAEGIGPIGRVAP